MSLRREIPVSQEIEPVGLDLRDLFHILITNKLRIGAVTAVATLLTFGLAFLLPKWYRATTVILPPEQSDLMSNLSLAQRAFSKFSNFGTLPDYFTPADIYKAILSSRTIQEEVVTSHDLMHVYKIRSMEKAINELRSNTRVKLNADGTIAVSAEDRSPVRAAEIANTYVS